MPEIKSNSDKQREVKENKEPRTKMVVSKDDIVKETQARSDFKEFIELFVPEDKAALKRSIMERVADGIRQLASDLFNSIIGMPTGGVITSSNSGKYWKGTTVVSAGSTPQPVPVTDPRNNGVEVRLRSQSAAVAVWKECAETLGMYPYLRVIDLKQAAGASTLTTDSDYGWKNMDKFQLVRNFDGTWSIIAPQPYEIK